MEKITMMWAVIISICGGVSTISVAVGVVASLVNKAHQPEVKQNERLSHIEERLNDHDRRLAKHEGFFKNDDERLKQIAESNRITQSGMLALLKHSINGQDIESLKKAEKDLEDYLITKD